MTFIAAQNGMSGSEKLWAEHGLTGLVIFALIGLIFYIIKSSNNTTKKILKDEREERRFTTEKHIEATDKLAGAIDKLSDSWVKNK